MMNLVCRPAGVVLVCSGCGLEWPVDEGQPFVSQLRIVALGHACDPDAGAEPDAVDGRRGHLRLVSDPDGQAARATETTISARCDRSVLSMHARTPRR